MHLEATMMRSTRSTVVYMRLLIAVAALLTIGTALSYAAEIPNLGRLDFPNSGAEEAQAPFLRGVLLLHNFEYDDSAEAFVEAQTADPDFALAYWGEAMTHNHPLWRQIDQDAALAALAKLAPTHEERLAKTPTERERGYLRALQNLLGEGDKSRRDDAYSAAMGQLSATFPEDQEAKAFYALSILGTQNGRRDFATYMRAGAIAEEVFAANPRHPGAVHYMIHSYDDPVHAPLGVRAARVYADIAPAASHAQHMISHIFVALGHWEESVDSNLKSFEVSRERAERKELGVDALNYHALQWLQYSYLQLGREQDARDLLDQMERYAGESDSERASWYHAYMRAAWVVETGKDAPGGHGADSEEAGAQVLDHFASGFAAVESGDLVAAAEAHELLAAAVDELDGDEEASDEQRVQGRVLEKSLRAKLELADGETAVALALLAEAAEAEASLALDFGPPNIVKPSHELFGEALLSTERSEEARAQFEIALSRAPRRSQSLSGLAKAARALGDVDTADRACGELASIRAQATPMRELPSACSG